MSDSDDHEDDDSSVDSEWDADLRPTERSRVQKKERHARYRAADASSAAAAASSAITTVTTTTTTTVQKQKRMWKRKHVAKKSRRRSDASDSNNDKQQQRRTPGVTNSASIVNLLSIDGVDEMVRLLRRKWAFESTGDGCLIPCRVKNPSSKRKQLVNREGYAYVDVPAELLPSSRGKSGRCDFHPLMYRFWYRRQIDDGHVIAHLCGNRACGAKAHLRAVLPRVNEDHKRCCYVQAGDDDDLVYLLCNHGGECRPDRSKVYPLYAQPALPSVPALSGTDSYWPSD